MWFITANTNSCRIFNYEKKTKKLTLIKELNNPLGKLKGSEIVTDRPGHYNTQGGARGAYSAHETPKENEAEHFSQEIAKELDNGRRANQYNELILAAQPHMSGLINMHLDTHVKQCITNNVIKDFMHLSEPELLKALNDL
jgi:protein required for attachment to host cells